MVFSVLFMRPPKLVEATDVKGREAIGRRPTCPLLRVSHQLFTLIQMNNTGKIMYVSPSAPVVVAVAAPETDAVH
ncbi:MAG: hypothetical protein KAJ78_09545 [Acidobacteria bacterium]|nr:hypothetical protein [Acidobacteriota bacterium]